MIDPNGPMAHTQVNEFLPSNGTAAGARKTMVDTEMDEIDVSRFNAIRKEQKAQMMEVDKVYQEKQDIITKQMQAEEERLFNAFQQGMQSLYASLVQHVNANVEAQVKLRMTQEKLQDDHAEKKRDIDRQYHNEASRLVLSTSHSGSRIPKQLSRTTSNDSHSKSFTVSSNGDHHHQLTPTASVMQTPPIQHRIVTTRPVSVERLPGDFVLQEPPRREYLAPYPTPQEIVPAQRIPASSEPRPIQPQPVNAQPLPVRQTYDEPRHGQAQHASQQQPRYHHEPSNLTPSRSDFKRKAYELPVSDVTLNGLHAKRPRTSEMPVDGIFQDQYQSQHKPSPHTPRSSQPIRDAPIERSIPFQEIYQDGKAQYKHKIFEHKAGSGNWYIVRCDEHKVHFGYGNPLHGAAKHVHSPQHGNLEKKHDLALQVCGHRVTGCNAELAELNNRAFERAVKEEGYVPFNMNLLTKEGRRRLHDGAEILVQGEGHAKKRPAKLNINSDEANNVQDCRFYQGLWSPTKKWYALVVLPILPDGSLKDVGLPQTTLQETELMANVPKCYRVDRNSLQIKEWQHAYKLGGSKVNKREYPVMFFDGAVKYSLGWLPAYKLKPLDLDNPPNDVDRRCLNTARTWFAVKMMHREDWDEYKKSGPGRPSSSEGDMNKNGEHNPLRSLLAYLGSDDRMLYADQVLSLRSARTDDQSPIRDKSSKPDGFSASSSDEGSDEEDPMRMDIGPIPEPADSNYVDDSSSELSEVEMEDASKGEEAEAATSASSADTATTPIPKPLRIRVPESDKDINNTDIGEKTTGSGKGEAHSAQPRSSSEVGTPAKVVTEFESADRRPPLALATPDHDLLRRNAQARAAAAVMEAASRSRASSEVPEGVPGNRAELPSTNGRLSRPNGGEHHRSRSDDNFAIGAGIGLAPFSGHTLSEVRKPSDLHSILNQEHGSAPSGPNESPADPYKRAEAIAAQMEGLKSRSASAPIHEGKGTPSPFPPPPLHSAPPREAASQGQPQSPALSHILSPPVQSPVMIPPRSLSSTPMQTEVTRSSPKLLGSQDKFSMGGSASVAAYPRASFVNTTPTQPSSEPSPKAVSQPLMPRPLAMPCTQLGTPISDKQESFDVSQFRDSARGMRWSREGPETGFLRLTSDAMRGWAETAPGSPLTATVEPIKVTSIVVDTVEGEAEKERVNLIHRDGSQQTLVFETNSENQRLVKAAVQRRRFVNWLRKINSSVEYRYA